MKRKLLFSFLTALFAIPAVNVSAEEFKLDLSTATYTSASDKEVVWEADAFTMVAEKAGASTNANNYLGGNVNSANGKTNTSSIGDSMPSGRSSSTIFWFNSSVLKGA